MKSTIFDTIRAKRERRNSLTQQMAVVEKPIAGKPKLKSKYQNILINAKPPTTKGRFKL